MYKKLKQKMFGMYNVKFPLDNELSIIHGVNGGGKTQLMYMLAHHFEEQGERVLFFPDDRTFDITAYDALKILTAYKLRGTANVFDKYDIRYDLVVEQLEYLQASYITSGIAQILNFFLQIINCDREAIVIIDEVGRNLHIAKQRSIIEDLLGMDKVKKLIVTTHSPAICDNFRYSHKDSIINVNSCVDLTQNIFSEYAPFNNSQKKIKSYC